MEIKKSIAAISAAALLTGISLPAFAEGSWTSYLSGVKIGFESRTWADRDVDQVATTVKLTNCSVSGASFANAGLTLYQDTWIPYYYTNHGMIYNYCDSVSWGQGLGAGNYHFTVERINSSSTTTRSLSAGSVVTGY